MMFRRQLGAVLRGWIDRRVDFASQHLLRPAERVRCFGERHLADYHDINVACAPLLTPRNRPVDESRTYAHGKRRERGTQCVDDAGGLDDKSFQFGIYRAVRVGLEIYLATLRRL